jgi:hypothetical protein
MLPASKLDVISPFLIVSKWQDKIQKSKTKSGDFFLIRQESTSVEHFVMIIIICLFDNIFNERRKKRIESFRVSVVINDLRERNRKI